MFVHGKSLLACWNRCELSTRDDDLSNSPSRFIAAQWELVSHSGHARRLPAGCMPLLAMYLRILWRYLEHGEIIPHEERLNV
jgi:hypothetical protein